MKKTIRVFTAVIFLICGVNGIGLGQVSFMEHTITSSFAGGWDVCAVDVNRDGWVDIVSAAYNDKIKWWENDGTGNFIEHVVTETLYGPRSVRAADVNGDGSMDVLAGCFTTNEVRWWENDGSQNFTEHLVESNFMSAHTVDANDVDKDGDTDILCSEFAGDGRIAWWENDGGENFTVHVISSRFTQSPFIVGEDLDGDSDLDILACCEAQHDVYWWENDGSQNFTEHAIDNNFNSAHTVLARDVDSDGDMDVLGCAYYSGLFSWWENDGSQNFTLHSIDNVPNALWIDATDLDRDGDLDVYGTGGAGVLWYENNGSQVFAKHAIPGNFSGGYCVVTADFDDDKDADLVSAARSSNKITWWENSQYMFHFSVNQKTGHAPLQVQFDDLSVDEVPITSRQWDFDNDGAIDSREKSPAWTYETPGSYSVKLIVASDSSAKTILYENYIQVFDGNSGVLFNGLDSDILCPASPSLNLTEAFTIEAWIHPKGWGEAPGIGFGRIVDKKKFALFLIGASTSLNENCLALQLIPASGSPSISTTPDNSITLDTWQHVAVTYNAQANEVNMYINGELQTITQTVAPSGPLGDNSSANLCIGNIESRNFTFDGALDEVRIWNMVHAAEVIRMNMNLQFIANKNGMAACWSLNEGAGDEISDISDNSNTGTITNGQWIQGVSLMPTQIGDSRQNRQRHNFRLYNNYPNPFNPETKISYELPEPGHVQLLIYNVNGGLVKTLVDGYRNSGHDSVVWNATDSSGKRICSGIYFYKLVHSNGVSDVKKMVLVK